ncbi:MAG: cyclic lactone autoinducer peptide [Eubacteriales bacterium]|nr:cyclic lactone autoinducer peptide [Eubacteriales bacterium]MDD4475662.1 cyclic lactone autoinducer peptide [Eubacteriales bacterium]
MKKTLYSALAIVATLVASLVASSACFWFIYQPQEPKSLQD